MRPGHHLAGASAGLAVAAVAGWPFSIAAVSAVVAAAVAPLPDIDQRRWWEPLRVWLPFQHRRLTHWWGLPAATACLVPLLPGPTRWLLVAVVAGWTSHLAADWVFGKRGPRSTGWRGPGIPFAPWWGHHGLGLKCGGQLERHVAYPALTLVLLIQLTLMIGL
jgi:hypothetical protein